jgi:hypothetical protein
MTPSPSSSSSSFLSLVSSNSAIYEADYSYISYVLSHVETNVKDLYKTSTAFKNIVVG